MTLSNMKSIIKLKGNHAIEDYFDHNLVLEANLKEIYIAMV